MYYIKGESRFSIIRFHLFTVDLLLYSAYRSYLVILINGPWIYITGI